MTTDFPHAARRQAVKTPPPALREPGALAENTEWMSVTRINECIRDRLEGEFAYVKVEGEMVGLKRPASGHLYFTLSDGTSQLRAVVWRQTAQRLTLQPTDGQRVRATGRITVYPPRGEYQMVVEGLRPAGIGPEREQLLRLYAQLAAEGVFNPERKRPLPLLPSAIGVVTSASSAVIHDILQVLGRRFPGYKVILAPARVQGLGAAEELAAALDRLNADGRAEVILCGRGGGSGDDLAAFNSELVVRAIARSRIPVISAVGHEIDTTLADLAADQRAPTPSAAAELAVPERAALLERLRELSQRSTLAVRRMVQRQRERGNRGSAALKHPRHLIERWRQRNDELSERLLLAMPQRLSLQQGRVHNWQERLKAWTRGGGLLFRRLHLGSRETALRVAVRHDLAQRQQRLSALQGRLVAVAPLAVLARGYAVVTDRHGVIIRRPDQVQPFDPLQITLAEGTLQVLVTTPS